jgi:probable F420-dependent oxidoreductase
MTDVRFGVRSPALPAASGPELLAAFAERAEQLGLSSFWLPDRLVPVGGYLSFANNDPLLEPMTGLAYVAARTSRILLGTGVVIAPLRHPLVLAKAAANVHYLSGGRLILGLGTGWAPEEFDAVGVPRSERGTRTDEAIDVLRAAFTGDTFEHRGPHHTFGPVRIDPVLVPPCPIWGAGGMGAAEFGVAGSTALAPAVARRLARLDGWLTRPAVAVEQIVEGYEQVCREAEVLDRDPACIELGHVNFCHLVDGDRRAALDAQRSVFSEVLGDTLSFDRIQELHWTGTLQDVANRVARLIDAGVRHIVLHPLRADPAQVELWVEGVLGCLGRAHKSDFTPSSPAQRQPLSVPIDPARH